MSAPAPTITFLSDYGLDDEFVGVCHAVIARRCPHARVIDLTHGIPPGDVRAGAIVLRGALPYAPQGVHLAVVDPGVGGPRRAVALRTAPGGVRSGSGSRGADPGVAGGGNGARVLVGPDNGLLLPAAERFGGVREAVALDASGERLEPASHTFHGRDIFAPVAAAVAAGAALADVGDPLDPASLHALDLPVAREEAGALVAHVVHRDRFGNVLLDAAPAQLDARGMVPGTRVAVGAGAARIEARRAVTFSDVGEGELLLYVDGLGMVALAVNRGSAQALLGIAGGDEVRLAPAHGAA